MSLESTDTDRVLPSCLCKKIIVAAVIKGSEGQSANHPPRPILHHPPIPIVHHPPRPIMHHPPRPIMHHPPRPIVHHPFTPILHHPPRLIVHHPPIPVVKSIAVLPVQWIPTFFLSFYVICGCLQGT